MGSDEIVLLDSRKGILVLRIGCFYDLASLVQLQRKALWMNILSLLKMGIHEKIKKIEEEMARTQKNKATEYHLGRLKAQLAKLRSQLL